MVFISEIQVIVSIVIQVLLVTYGRSRKVDKVRILIQGNGASVLDCNVRRKIIILIRKAVAVLGGLIISIGQTGVIVPVCNAGIKVRPLLNQVCVYIIRVLRGVKVIRTVDSFIVRVR